MAKNIKINGVTYSNVPYISIPLAEGSDDAEFYDVSDGTAAGNVLSGETCYNSSGKTSGSMPNNGAVTGTISTPGGEYTIPAGYHNGSGKAKINPTEAAKIVSGNIKSGASILGVTGSPDVVNTGDANATAAQKLSGRTAYVGGTKVTGSLTLVNVSQDSTTKVVSIS